MKAFCDAEWGHDADMHEYCIELQVEASDLLDGLKTEHPAGSDGARIIAACEAE